MPHSIFQEILKELGKMALDECVKKTGEIMYEILKEKVHEAKHHKHHNVRLGYYFKVDLQGVVTKEYISIY